MYRLHPAVKKRTTSGCVFGKGIERAEVFIMDYSSFVSLILCVNTGKIHVDLHPTGSKLFLVDLYKSQPSSLLEM